ncbi:MAG: imidazolonepropionase [Vulcanimicrobiaceae bacterium]
MRAGWLIPCEGDAPQNGVTFEQLGALRNGAVLIAQGQVASIGTRAAVERDARGFRDVDEVDFREGIIVPGFIDAHTHPFFWGDREADFAARLAGDVPPLGMPHTIAQTRGDIDGRSVSARFADRARLRLRNAAKHGTTTIEVKTGYALDARGEIALLDFIAQHADRPSLPRLVCTFLGAHAVPPEFSDEAAYIDFLIAEILPVAKHHGAVYADAFCEPGFFSVPEVRRYLIAARGHGLRLRVHCDEMAFNGGAAMAAELRVDAVDHANCIREQDVAAIVAAGIVTVACPATIAYLGLESRAPVRDLLQSGGRVALASDFNPGTSPCINLQTVAYFGRALFGLTAAEALYGVTRAAAGSLRSDCGSLRAGSSADLVLLEIENPAEFGWQFGGNLARSVFRHGVPVA